MSFFGRILLAVILLLTCLTGGLLFAYVATQNFAAGMQVPVVAGVRDRDADQAPTPSLSRILSRLPLLPMFSHRKPLVAVVIENHESARPHQQGLQDALLVSEYLVEGFITRFVALYDARALPVSLGPVRSLRPYFIEALIPWTSIFVHAGGSPEALERVQKDPKLLSINGLRYSKHFLREPGIPAPHDLFVSREHLEDLLPEGIAVTAWPPYEIGAAQARERAKTIRVGFFNETHDVLYEYDAFSHRYHRTNGGIVSEAQPTNILILEIPVDGEGEYGRLLIDMEGEGDLLLLRSGIVIPGQWHKRLGETFTFSVGEEDESLQFARGQTWMMVLNTLDRVSWIGEEL
ncbi:hypothetical protein COU80_02130 [Candidatus Peregrinibacteria bacterium CG10_big_fil_rev_8_21_14_0_10_55_24]|nr:MAG: hypothetical protein COU80_02130 [Candidatus Peregrinibacteria bacterium CG10_big_fil_rev_8_21_14_0_10_55_24]